MPQDIMDIFNGDPWSTASLTAKINEQPEGQAVNSWLDRLFTETGITSTTVAVERNQDSLELVTVGDRGSYGSTKAQAGRDLVPFSTFHLPRHGGINADQVLSLRALGGEEAGDAAMQLAEAEIARLRKDIEATINFHRLGALAGRILNPDMSVILDINQRFGVQPQNHYLDLTNPASEIGIKILAAKRKSEDAVGDLGSATRYIAACSRTYYDDLIVADGFKEAFARAQDGAQFRNDTRSGFVYMGIEWIEAHSNVGGVTFIDEGTALLVPTSIPDLFVTSFAPADYVDLVSIIGVPFYAKQEVRRMGKGIDIEVQSNPLSLNKRPRSVITLHSSAAP